MKISDLKVGQKLKDGVHFCEVAFINSNSVGVQYRSGSCIIYTQESLDKNLITTL
jgi:hypothetical protein